MIVFNRMSMNLLISQTHGIEQLAMLVVADKLSVVKLI